MIDLDKVIYNLVDLVKNKYDLLDDIYELTKKQSEVIDNVELDVLSILIDEKQERIDLIRKVDNNFEAIVSDLKILYDIKSLDELEVKSPNIAILKENVKNVMEILKNIVELEASNKEKITSKKNQLEVKMGKTQNGKKAIKQYGNIGSYTDAYFFDKKIK